MKELTLEEKIELEFQSKLDDLNLEYVNWRYLTEEYCQSVVGKEIQIEDEIFKVNSVVDRNALDEDGFKKEEGAIKFYLEDANGKEVQYFLNPETNGNTEHQITASLGILKAIYQENKMDVLSKFDDEDSDMYLNYKIKEYLRDIGQYIDKLPNDKEKLDSEKELEILYSNFKDAVEKIDVFKTPRVIALDILKEPYENLEILKTKLYNHLITQKINPMENQEEKKAFDLKAYLQKQDEFFKGYEIRNPEGKFYDNDIVKTALIYKAHKMDFNELLDELEKTTSVANVDVKLTDKEKDNPILISRDKRALLSNYFNDCSATITNLKANIIEDQTKPVPKREFVKDDAIFDKISDINIVEFLDRTGKFEVSKNNSQSWRNQLENRAARGIKIKEVDTNNTYMVFNGADKKFFIMTPPPDKSFSGNLLKFVAEKVLGHPTVKDKEAKREAINYIKQFYSEAELGSPSTVKAQYSNLESSRLLKENYSNRELELKDLKYPIYLVSRGINPTTLGNSTFKPLIKHVVDKNNPDKQNIAFLFKDNENKMTFQELNLGNKGYYQADVSTKGMLFVSNAKGKKDELIFAESVIDLLSYAQLNGIRKEVDYVASGGFLNSGQVSHLSSLMDDKKYDKITLCVDNDLQGEIYKKQIIEAVLQREIDKEQRLDTPSLDNVARLEDLLQKSEGLNNLVFNKELSKEERQSPLTEMNQSIIKELSSLGLQTIEIQNPKGKDFNEDLMKQSGMSRENCQASVINDDFTADKLFNMEKKSGLDARQITDKYIESNQEKSQSKDSGAELTK